MDMIISKSWTLCYSDEVQPCESTTLYFTMLRALETESAKLTFYFICLVFFSVTKNVVGVTLIYEFILCLPNRSNNQNRATAQFFYI